ncbi:MAG TPA: hypothetical protein PLK38_08365, partial [Methanoregulaceae archaeon]|nr:hypothetical protein [Methanoregulaceae archaeon]
MFQGYSKDDTLTVVIPAFRDFPHPFPGGNRGAAAGGGTPRSGGAAGARRLPRPAGRQLRGWPPHPARLPRPTPGWRLPRG